MKRLDEAGIHGALIPFVADGEVLAGIGAGFHPSGEGRPSAANCSFPLRPGGPDRNQEVAGVSAAEFHSVQGQTRTKNAERIVASVPRKTARQNDFVKVIDDSADRQGPQLSARGKPWQVLIVDDESEVHHATLFALSGLTVSGRGLEFLHAYSGKDAREVLARHGGVALILLDVVMETEDSGLKLVHFVRQDLGMSATRIVLRTGQPGYAPEMRVIQEYDINDYKTKSELTRTRLATTVTTAIRSFEQIQTIESGREGLNRIVQAAPDMFARRGMHSFCEGALTQICALLGVAPEGLACAQTGSPFNEEMNGELRVAAAAGKYRPLIEKPLSALTDRRVAAALGRTIEAGRNLYEQDFTTLFMRDHADNKLVLFLDTQDALSEMQLRLLEVFGTNISIGFENVTLFERLHAYAYFDPLCSLPNRNRFVDLIDAQISSGRDGWVVGIIDIDHFSETNDTLGHENGDLLLKAIAARLRNALREEVAVARVAGDTFGVFGRTEDVDPERLTRLFAEPFAIDGYALQIGVSIGLVRLGDSSGNGLSAMKNANIGLKGAKSKSRGGYDYYTQAIEAGTRERVKLAHDLRRSIAEQQLMLYYQPQVNLATGRVVGAEALIRWQNAEGKFIPPDKFIPVAEQSGLIRPIGEWVLRTACRQQREWHERGMTEFRMAVNVSMVQFRDPGFTGLVRSVIGEYGVDPRMIELEITESMAMDDMAIVTESLRSLKKIGVAVAIDDFGTGFSSLGHLQQLSIDRLKIDRIFINSLAASNERSSIARMIVKLGQSLGLEVVAEGVETEEQADMLRQMGCDGAQGYRYCWPIKAMALEQWLCARGEMQ
jgi:diguanylate cyclase (GGDEF)-like protein